MEFFGRFCRLLFLVNTELFFESFSDSERVGRREGADREGGWGTEGGRRSVLEVIGRHEREAGAVGGAGGGAGGQPAARSSQLYPGDSALFQLGQRAGQSVVFCNAIVSASYLQVDSVASWC